MPALFNSAKYLSNVRMRSGSSSGKVYFVVEPLGLMADNVPSFFRRPSQREWKRTSLKPNLRRMFA